MDLDVDLSSAPSKWYWPFDDYQPIGLVDLVITGICTSMILWPPFLGLLQWACCVEGWPHPMNARFFHTFIFLLELTGAGLGFFCSLMVILGGYYRLFWLRQYGPYLLGMVIVGVMSFAYPEAFKGIQIPWRPDWERILSGMGFSLPASWATVRIVLKLAAVHPHRDLMNVSLPHSL